MRILLADDHDLIRDTVEAFLSRMSDDVEVVHAGTLPQALEAANTNKVTDLVLLDLRMPGMNGLAGIRIMKKALPSTPIVVFSGDISGDVIRTALQAGASGYIPKTMRAPAMLNALRLVMSGERYIPDIAVNGDNMRPMESEVTANGVFSTLTARERQVLGLLVKGNSNKQIARELEIEEITVALHLRSVYRKLKVHSRTQAVRLAMQMGWDA